MHSIDFFISTNYLVNFPWKHEDSEMVALKTPKLPTLFRNWQFLLVTIIVPCYTFDAKSFFPTSESPVSACTKCYLRKKYCIGQGGKECWNQLQCALVCKIMLTICYRSAYLAAFLKPNLQNSLQLALKMSNIAIWLKRNADVQTLELNYFFFNIYQDLLVTFLFYKMWCNENFCIIIVISVFEKPHTSSFSGT